MTPRQTFNVKCPDCDSDVVVMERPRIAQTLEVHCSVGQCPTCGKTISRVKWNLTGIITVKAYGGKG